MNKKMNKKEKMDKIMSMIRKMEANEFLLPDNWSDIIYLKTRTAYYKTYVGGRGEESRYIILDYTSGEELHNPKRENSYSIEFRRGEIIMSRGIGETKNMVDFVLDIVETIYKEKNSFEIMDKEVSKRRVEMIKLRNEIKAKKEEFEKIKRELGDYKKIKK